MASAKIIGQVFKQRRLEMGLSLKEAEERSGVPINTISRIERGTNNALSSVTLFRLCNLYKISPNTVAAFYGLWEEPEEYDTELTAFIQGYLSLPEWRRREIAPVMRALIQMGRSVQ